MLQNLKLVLVLLLLGVSLPASAPACAQDDPPPENESWSSFLPLLGDAARERGYELPLPFGLGFHVMHIWQDYEIKSLDLVLKGPMEVPLRGLQVSSAEGTAYSMDGRLDCWILPWLNVYGVLGYTSGQSKSQATVPASTLAALGLPLGHDLSFPFPLEYDGATYGGGGTLAYGYKHLFGSIDYNYTETDLDIADSSIHAHVLTPRVGWFGELGSAYVGAMYQDVAQAFRGSLNFKVPGPYPIPPIPVDYAVDQKATDPWNIIVGANLRLGRHVEFIIEGGFLGREQILTSLTYRF